MAGLEKQNFHLKMAYFCWSMDWQVSLHGLYISIQHINIMLENVSYSQYLNVSLYMWGPFEKFTDWQQHTDVMQREAVIVMPSCSGGSNPVVAYLHNSNHRQSLSYSCFKRTLFRMAGQLDISLVERQHCVIEFWNPTTHPSSLWRQCNEMSCSFQVVEVL